jgi:hypothetical protein
MRRIMRIAMASDSTKDIEAEEGAAGCAKEEADIISLFRLCIRVARPPPVRIASLFCEYLPCPFFPIVILSNFLRNYGAIIL